MQGLAKQSGHIMFINFLMGKFPHLRKAYSTDKEMVDHFLSGEVTVPFTDVLKYVDEWESAKPKLPSRFQLGSLVFFDAEVSGQVNNCRIIKVHFTESKVLYDLEVAIVDETAPVLKNKRKPKPKISYTTRLYNIDSAFVKPADPNFKEWYDR